MIEQMKKRLKVQMPDSAAYPVWAWYQWQSDKKKKPDLRFGGYLPRGKKGYRIEFEIEDDKVLLSDFDLFHYVLNYWYIPKNEEEDNLFDYEMEKNKIEIFDLDDFSKDSRILDELRNKVERSWDLIFHLDWYDEYVTHIKNEKAIQAAFWELRWDQVVDVKEFISR